MLWEPAIYEHKAALIDRPVGQVAQSAELLTRAVIREREVYGADFITVGVDVYNIEAEACGSKIVTGADHECPEIRDHLWDIQNLPDQLDIPDMSRAGRCEMMLRAGRDITDAIGDECRIRMAASGPVSIAAKLVGLEKLVMALAMQQDHASRLLEFATELGVAWCEAVREQDLEAIIFDSAASPPMISPRIYADQIQPRHAKMMDALAESGQANRPLIIGGDTTEILPAMIDAGATMLICDYTCDARNFAEALPESSDARIRRNVDPSMFSGTQTNLQDAAARLASDLELFERPIAGTGILPYDARPDLFWEFRRNVESSRG